MPHGTSLIDRILTDDPVPRSRDLKTWKSVHDRSAAPFTEPFDRAVAAAFGADTVGWAFASAYVEALRGLFEGALDEALVHALCVTEETGNSPKAIETTLEGATLNGTKTFITMGTEANRLIVLAHRKHESESPRKDLVLVAIDARAPGVEMQELPAMPFVPEIPHARVTFRDAKSTPAELFVDNAWDDYVKPFRTVEDVFVFGAVLSWLLRLARWTHQVELVSRLTALIGSAREVSGLDPKSPATHLAFAGLDKLAQEAVEMFDWTVVDEATRTSWERDRGLLRVAGKARAARLDLAERLLRLRPRDIVFVEEYDDGRQTSTAQIWSDGWISFQGYENAPRGSGAAEDMLDTDFLRHGAPSWVHERVEKGVRRWLEERSSH